MRAVQDRIMDATAESRLHITRPEIISRGLANRCPNCGSHSLFPPRSLHVHDHCPVCGMEFDPGGGFWLGPWVINYLITVVFFVLPLILLGASDIMPLPLAMVLAVLIGGFGLPMLLYRWSWSWWLMVYFFFFPYKLPANGAGLGPHAQE
jgi:uncharacterized protein (DUF983 family)